MRTKALWSSVSVSPYFGTLEILLHKGPQSVTEIAHRIGLTAGSMSVALDRLEKRGLVRRHAHPTDRRNRVIRLTAAGKTPIEKAFREHALAMENVGKSLSSEERARLSNFSSGLGRAPKSSYDRPRDPDDELRKLIE